jgi:acetyltransferase-like isoleucine patch superfamily enzyme
MFHGKSPDGHEDIASSPIIIEDDAWIGFGSAIFKGVTVGKGAVVAAMSVVTKDVAPYTVVAGNPARQIGVSRQ